MSDDELEDYYRDSDSPSEFKLARDVFEVEENELSEPFASMKTALGPHLFEMAYDEANSRNPGEQAVDFTFRMVLEKTLRCFGYVIQPMQIDMTSIDVETLRSALSIVSQMRELERETDDPWLEDYVFGEPREETNPTQLAKFTPDGKIYSTEAPKEVMEFAGGVVEGLRKIEPYIGKFARDLGLSQQRDIQHPAVAEMAARRGGRAH